MSSLYSFQFQHLRPALSCHRLCGCWGRSRRPLWAFWAFPQPTWPETHAPLQTSLGDSWWIITQNDHPSSPALLCVTLHLAAATEQTQVCPETEAESFHPCLLPLVLLLAWRLLRRCFQLQPARSTLLDFPEHAYHHIMLNLQLLLANWL